MADLLILLKDEWNVISANPWTFILYGVLVFGISWVVHHYLISVKLHNIPEREALQKEVDQLKSEITELEKALHRQDIEDLIK